MFNKYAYRFLVSIFQVLFTHDVRNFLENSLEATTVDVHDTLFLKNHFIRLYWYIAKSYSYSAVGDTEELRSIEKANKM